MILLSHNDSMYRKEVKKGGFFILVRVIEGEEAQGSGVAGKFFKAFKIFYCTLVGVYIC